MSEIKAFSAKLLRAIGSMSEQELNALEDDADAVIHNYKYSAMEIFFMAFYLGEKTKSGYVFCGGVGGSDRCNERTFFFVGTEFEIMKKFERAVNHVNREMSAVVG